MRLGLIVIFLLLLAVPSFVHAQGDPQISLRDFSGGLNTAISPLLLNQNQATELQNVYLSDETGALVKRRGFLAITDTINGTCDLTGIYGAVNRSGRKRMYGVIDTSTTTNSLYGLGGLFVSANFGYNLDTSLAIYPYVYTGETPYWTMWKNDVFLSNGRQVPIIVHNDSARDLVVQPPGSPRIYPMNDAPATGFGLNGEYRYAYTIESNCGSGFGSDLLGAGQPNDNGDFEDWTGGDPDHWLLSNATATQETDSIHGGTSACLLEPSSIYSAVLFDTVVVDSNKQYKVTVWFNNDSITGGYSTYGYYVKSRPSGSNLGQFMESHSRMTGWEERTLYVDIPSGDDSIVIVVWTDYTSTPPTSHMYIDDISVKEVTGQQYYESYLTQPITAFDEKVLHANFIGLGFTPTCDTSDGEFDTLKTVSIYRTRSYPHDIISELDTMWKVGGFYNITNTILDTLKFIDSIPDDSLGTGGYTATHFPDFDRLGRDSVNTITGVRVGAPTYIGRNTGTGNCIAFDEDSASTGADSIYSAIGIAYMVTFKDTLTGIESDSSRNLYIWIDSIVGADTADTNFNIGLPPIPAGRNHLIRVLYKAYGTSALKDTTAGNVTIRYDTVYADRPEDVKIVRPDSRQRWGKLIPINRLDTIFQQYYQLAIIRDSSVKSFLDTIRADTVLARPAYVKDMAPPNIRNMTVWGDYMVAFEGSNFFWSRIDSAADWGIFNHIAFNADDGDEGTAIVPYENHIKYYKNNSQFILLPTDNAEIPFEREKVISGIGCIAPLSVVSYLSDIYYLSNHGFIRERAIPHRENTSSYDTISVPINNILLAHTADVLRNAVGVAVPRHQEIRWSIPSIDTTFVYNTLTRGWSINDYSFNQTTYYDTTKDANIEPARDLLFITNNSDRIFKADTTASDSGQAFYFKYESPLLGGGYNNISINGVGLLLNVNNLGGLIYTINAAKGDSVYADSIQYSTTQSGRYRRFLPGNNYQEYFSIELRSSSLVTTPFKIRQLNLWTSPSGVVEIE